MGGLTFLGEFLSRLFQNMPDRHHERNKLRTGQTSHNPGGASFNRLAYFRIRNLAGRNGQNPLRGDVLPETQKMMDDLLLVHDAVYAQPQDAGADSFEAADFPCRARNFSVQSP